MRKELERRAQNLGLSFDSGTTDEDLQKMVDEKDSYSKSIPGNTQPGQNTVTVNPDEKSWRSKAQD